MCLDRAVYCLFSNDRTYVVALGIVDGEEDRDFWDYRELECFP